MSSVIYRDKITPTRVIIPTQQIVTKDNEGWATQCIEVSVAATDGRLICRKTFIHINTLADHYRREEL